MNGGVGCRSRVKMHDSNMKLNSNSLIKLGLGLAVSGLFLYLAFRQIDFRELLEVIVNSDEGILILALFVLFASHWFRAVRHRYLLEPIKKVKNSSLFSALVIGYMANTLLPAHLGEFLRAYVIGKKEAIPGGSAFATIVVERIIDVISLLIIMGIILMVHPFPEMVKLSAYLTFAVAIGIVGLLALLKLKPKQTLRFVEIIAAPLPGALGNKLSEFFMSFSSGLVGLKNRKSYLMVFTLSVAIWVCYAGVFEIGLYAFDFVELYNLPMHASLVLLVIVTVSILVPSSPGYVGTYHWLCLIGLGFFGVPDSSALGYAIALHAISIIPVALLGVVFSLRNGIEILKIGRQEKLEGFSAID